MSNDYNTWTTEELIDKAFSLMNRADEILSDLERKCEEIENGQSITRSVSN